MTSVLVPLAEGFEEIEAMTIIDVLRRAEIDVTVASLSENQVKGAHGVTVIADTLLSDAASQTYDMVVLPGGQPGSDKLAADDRVIAMIKKTKEEGKPVAAICAAPIVLSKAGILKDKKATAYPGFREKLDAQATTDKEKVVIDGDVITSQGPGTAMTFALKIVEVLKGKGLADTLRKGMLVEE